MSPDTYVEMAKTEAHHWWFVGRRSILDSTIRQLNLPNNASILEIGSGTGGNLSLLSTFGRVSALEMDPTARALAGDKTDNRFDIRAGSFPNDIPFFEQKFDLICLFDVLEHIEDDVATLVAVKGLLATDGRVLLTVPAYRCLWSSHDEHLHHKRRYSSSELQRKVISTGLKVARITYFNTMLFPLVAAVRFKDHLLGLNTSSGTRIPPAFYNSLLRRIFSAERFLLAHIDLPIGVSLLALLRSE